MGGEERAAKAKVEECTWNSEGESAAIVPLDCQTAKSAAAIEENIHQLVTFNGLIKGYENFSICLQQANSINWLICH